MVEEWEIHLAMTPVTFFVTWNTRSRAFDSV
jgi:hypothetical protein